MVPDCKGFIWTYFDNIAGEGVAICKLCIRRVNSEGKEWLKKHIYKEHDIKRDVWKYCTVEDDFAECKICNKRWENNRTHLYRHLKTHNITVEDETDISSTAVASANVQQCGSTSREEKQDDQKLGSPIGEQEQSTEKLSILMEEKILSNALVGLMIDEGVAPSIFASKNMQNLLNPVCEAISEQKGKNYFINDQQGERAIQSMATSIRTNFAAVLQWRLLSLRIDTSAVLSHSTVFRVGVQFVNGGQLESRVLNEIHVERGQQLSSESIVSVLQDCYIDTKQVVSAYWDNSKANYGQSISNSEYLQHIQDFEENPEIVIDNIKLERYIGVIAQMCLLDVLKNPVIFKLFLECRNLTKFINEHPDVYNEAFKQNNLKVPHLDLPWIWGSTYDMMNDIKNAFCILDNIKYDPPESAEDGFDFNETLKNFIEAFCQAFRFLQKCLLKFYDTEMIYGDFFGHWLKCKLLTAKLYVACGTEDTILALISSQLIKSIDTRSEELLNRDHFKACLYLDPRFQHTLSITEKKSALDYLNQLWHQAKLYNKRLDDPVTAPLPVETALPPMILIDDDDNDDGNAILNEFLWQIVIKTIPTAIQKKLEQLKLLFQTVEANVLLFWEEFKVREPEIHALSEICFAIPATQNNICNKITPLNQPSPSTNVSPIFQKNLNFLRLNQRFLPTTIERLDLFREDNSNGMEISENSEPSPQPFITIVINGADQSDTQ